MVNWQVTATTLYCADVDDEVTVMVFKDGSIKCVGYEKYGSPDKETAKLLKEKGKKTGRNLACEGIACEQATRYRDKLFTEETPKAAKSGKESS